MPASTPVTTADATPTLTLSETDRSRLQTVVHVATPRPHADARPGPAQTGRGLEPRRDLSGLRRLPQHRREGPHPLRRTAGWMRC